MNESSKQQTVIPIVLAGRDVALHVTPGVPSPIFNPPRLPRCTPTPCCTFRPAAHQHSRETTHCTASPHLQQNVTVATPTTRAVTHYRIAAHKHQQRKFVSDLACQAIPLLIATDSSRPLMYYICVVKPFAMIAHRSRRRVERQLGDRHILLDRPIVWPCMSRCCPLDSLHLFHLYDTGHSHPGGAGCEV